MRISKISQETARIFSALSPNARVGRTTRSSKRPASFALPSSIFAQVAILFGRTTPWCLANGNSNADDDEGGRALGIATTIPLLGPAFGPIIGGIPVQAAGWRWLFWTSALPEIEQQYPLGRSRTIGNRRQVGYSRQAKRRTVCDQRQETEAPEEEEA
ncbi:hypothetical protein AYO21_09149 [Fonsecaea monophora]|uniref:Major facilitator superfamily (MFS) profile domain-containing protein n=1 Tax=Fonsecaea monophora TaxID=254056 RepID=A0A177EX78_9EURO|nr:hypothetical protein AYO21_09149 [Fonsecaea monophora]OAG36674.1 hypothetical protein AYO21_09149 [Fonsecaea monophora]